MIEANKLVKLVLFWTAGLWALPVISMTDVSIAVYAEHDQYIEASAPYGVSWKLIELAAQSQGLNLVPEKVAWQGGLKRLKAKKVRLIFPAFKTPEREKWGLFTYPLIPTGSSIFTYPNNPIKQIDSINFEQDIVGVNTNSVQEKLATKVGFQHIYATTERDQLFRMLRQKRLDYLFLASAVANYYCVFFDPANQSDCLKQVGEEFNKKPARALSLNTPKATSFMRKINAGLVSIKDSEAVETLFKQYQYTAEDIQSWRSSIVKK